jgi:NAD-dependent deacetylase
MESHFERMWLLTQNVDGLHRQAGSQHLIEIHGDLHELLCRECAYRERVPDYSQLRFPPRCPQCPALLRPDVVLFGEMLPEEQVARLFEELDIGFDLVFTIGTTSVFPYIAEPVRRARSQGIPTVEINPGRSEVSHHVDVRLPLRAAVALDAIWCRYQQRRKTARGE